MVVQDDIDIVFECLNGLEPANTLIQKALKRQTCHQFKQSGCCDILRYIFRT